MEHYVIIVAGGSGTRMQQIDATQPSVPKQFFLLEGKPIIAHTIEKFQQALPASSIYVVLPAAHRKTWEEITLQWPALSSVEIVYGGETRFHSVQNGLNNIPSTEGLVAIHDAVRPLVSTTTIQTAFSTAKQKGSAVPCVALKDSIRKVNGVESTHQDRSLYKMIQTPQTFKLSAIKQAFKASYKPFFTDDASVYEAAGNSITLTEGNYENIKITTSEDLMIAKAFLKKS